MSLPCFVSLDAIVHDIGSSATLGNTSNSPETGGAYVIPTATVTKDGYILAWELVASKLGPIRLQVSFQATLVPQCISLVVLSAIALRKKSIRKLQRWVLFTSHFKGVLLQLVEEPRHFSHRQNLTFPYFWISVLQSFINFKLELVFNSFTFEVRWLFKCRIWLKTLGISNSRKAFYKRVNSWIPELPQNCSKLRLATCLTSPGKQPQLKFNV